MSILRERVSWSRPRRPSRVAALAPDEIAHVRSAIRALMARHRTNAALAKALGCCVSTLSQAKRRRVPSAALAVRVARVAGASLGDILSGAWPPPGMCAHCGHVAPLPGPVGA